MAATTNTSLPGSWDVLQTKKGQPDSYGFLCAMLFRRWPEFDRDYIDQRGRPAGQLTERDRNFPADIGLIFRKEFIGQKDNAKAVAWLANEAHAFRV